MTALPGQARPAGRHVPRRRGRAPPTAGFSPGVRWLASRLDMRVRGVATTPDALADDHLGGDYERAVQRHRGRALRQGRRRGPPRARRSSSSAATSPARASTCCWRRCRRCPPTCGCGSCGDGPETERLRARHAGDPRIEWLGRITDEEKRRRLRGADVFCAPSLRGESFGVVLLEAMAARAAIVAVDLPGYRNVARPDRDAVLVPPGDRDALAGALRRVLADPDLRARLVSSGEERADEFSMDHLADRYLELYERVIALHR